MNLGNFCNLKIYCFAILFFGSIFLTNELKLEHARAFVKDDCWHIDFDHGSTACLCEEMLCPEHKFVMDPSTVNSYLTTIKDDRMKYETFRFSLLEPRENHNRLKVLLSSAKQQTIQGFGGTLNDATVYNIYAIPRKLRPKLLNALFDSETGLGLNYLRIPIGGTDFSSTGYSLADEISVYNISLSVEDINYRIPLINSIKNTYRNIKFNFIGSVWSPPAWMKSNHNLKGGGRIRGEPGIGWFFEEYAKYIVRFLEQYYNYGIEFFGVTPVNVEQDPWKLRFVPSFEMSTLHQQEFRDLNLAKLISAQHPSWKIKIFNTRANSTMQHYGNDLSIYIKDYDTRLSDRPYDRAKIGSWSSAETYVRTIIAAIRNGASSFIDLSLVLNLYGKPNFAGVIGEAPIIIHEVESSFFRQPQFYMLAHFSKFIIPGSIVLDLEYSFGDDVQALAFRRPDNRTVMVLINFMDSTVDIFAECEFGYLPVIVPPKSIRTLVW